MSHSVYIPDLSHIKQLIFIRHAEKIEERQAPADLSVQGRFRADNLKLIFGRGNTPAPTDKHLYYNKPDIIFAMEEKDDEHSNRPYQTVQPLAQAMLMDTVEGEDNGGFFNNTFKKSHYEKMYRHLSEDKDDFYKNKTILFCWEHKTIPDIVAYFEGRKEGSYNWGSDPNRERDENTNFTAIWVLNPGLDKHDPRRFTVYKEFSIRPNMVDPDTGLCTPGPPEGGEFSLVPPRGPYTTCTWPKALHQVMHGDEE